MFNQVKFCKIEKYTSMAFLLTVSWWYLILCWMYKAGTLRLQWPNRIQRFPLRPWALGQPWKGSANDCRTKAKCLTARQGEAGETRLTWSRNRVQYVEWLQVASHRWPTDDQQGFCRLSLALAILKAFLTHLAFKVGYFLYPSTRSASRGTFFSKAWRLPCWHLSCGS